MPSLLPQAVKIMLMNLSKLMNKIRVMRIHYAFFNVWAAKPNLFDMPASHKYIIKHRKHRQLRHQVSELRHATKRGHLRSMRQYNMGLRTMIAQCQARLLLQIYHADLQADDMRDILTTNIRETKHMILDSRHSRQVCRLLRNHCDNPQVQFSLRMRLAQHLAIVNGRIM